MRKQHGSQLRNTNRNGRLHTWPPAHVAACTRGGGACSLPSGPTRIRDVKGPHTVAPPPAAAAPSGAGAATEAIADGAAADGAAAAARSSAAARRAASVSDPMREASAAAAAASAASMAGARFSVRVTSLCAVFILGVRVRGGG